MQGNMKLFEVDPLIKAKMQSYDDILHLGSDKEEFAFAEIGLI